MPGPCHSAKEKRQAKHIESSEEHEGHGARDAERITWATVNKEKSMKKGVLGPAFNFPHPASRS